MCGSRFRGAGGPAGRHGGRVAGNGGGVDGSGVSGGTAAGAGAAARPSQISVPIGIVGAKMGHIGSGLAPSSRFGTEKHINLTKCGHRKGSSPSPTEGQRLYASRTGSYHQVRTPNHAHA
jgi:hypothetical protein